LLVLAALVEERLELSLREDWQTVELARPQGLLLVRPEGMHS
jgi:hypothetical protein